MAWSKQGVIFRPSGEHEWNKTHAQVPTVDVLSDEVLRIYYSTRDSQNRSHVSFIEVSAEDPTKILYEHDSPVLAPDEVGVFDACGDMPSSLVPVGEKKYLYYIGWNVPKTVPYNNAIGLAVSVDGGRTFERFSKGPIFGRTYNEPYFTGTSWVSIENGVWKNWYMSCTGWQLVDGAEEPRYHIKYAESLDGIEWKREGTIAIDYKNEEEGGIVRACVLNAKNGYEMWYSYRKLANYRTAPAARSRIGYATSSDGVNWCRDDSESGIEPSEEGWDSFMTAYPCVVEVGGKRIMFYNGDGFGRTGIGFAIES